MTKAELIRKLEGLEDDDRITIALFGEDDYEWHLLQPNAQMQKDPANFIGLVVTPFKVRKDGTLKR